MGKDLFSDIMMRSYSWSGDFAEGREPRHMLVARLYEKLDNKKGSDWLRRINLFTYTPGNLEVNFKLAYYHSFNDKEFSPENYYWIEFTVDDRLRRMGKKRLVEIIIAKGEEGIEDYLSHFLRKKEEAEFVSTTRLDPDLENIKEFL